MDAGTASLEKAEPDCTVPRAMAVDLLRKRGDSVSADAFGSPDFFAPFDLNDDGMPDCALRYRGSIQLLFVATAEDRSEFRYVGEVTSDGTVAYGFLCVGDPKHGMCSLSASQHMIHGESQIRSYEFDGTKYVETSVRLTEPYRKVQPSKDSR